MAAPFKIINLQKPPLNNGKQILLRFDTANVRINTDYNFERDQDVNAHIITGVMVGSYSTTSDNFPKQMSIGGKVYNVIQFQDLAKVMITLKNKQQKKLIINSPLFRFNKNVQIEIQRFSLDLDLGGCYIRFVDSPLITPLPVVIPFNFFWD